MREHLGYEELFDSCWYSYDVRAAKPEPEFFTRVAGCIGAGPEEIQFIDDSAGNVAGARRAGLAAERWHFEDETPALVVQLARYGAVPVVLTAMLDGWQVTR
jgi:putative hydrolase of the HAD superfamily